MPRADSRSRSLLLLSVAARWLTFLLPQHDLVAEALGQWQPCLVRHRQHIRTPSPEKLQQWRPLTEERSRRWSVQKNFSLLRAPLDDETDAIENVATPSLPLVALFGSIGVLYWYWMVFGALAASAGWPGIPDWLPLVPGWPPSDADLAPVLEDSQHFFYLSELLQNPEAPDVQPVRLAAFNVAEAWIFAFLPLLWADPRRTNKWILLGSWAVLGINLTNAFLAPYLMVTELSSSAPQSPTRQKNRLVSSLFGGVSAAVVLFALSQCLTTATGSDWEEMTQLLKTDRTYLAFAVDLCLFSLFQPLILARVRPNRENKPTDFVPWFGLIVWLLSMEED